MYLKADFHCHIKVLSHWVFRPAQLLQRLYWAGRVGLNVLAITEHIDAPDFWEIYKCLELFCRENSGVFLWKRLTVLAGAEVNICEGGHILLIGSSAALRELERRLGRLDAGNYPRFKELLDASEDLGFLRIGAHPCRGTQKLWKLESLLKRLDALELNYNEWSMANWVQHQSRQLNLPVLAGSDSHHWLQLGRVYNLLPENGSFTVAGLKRTIAGGGVTWRRPGNVSVIIGSLLKGAVN